MYTTWNKVQEVERSYPWIGHEKHIRIDTSGETIQCSDLQW